MAIFLNNNVGNVILEKGAPYEVWFAATGPWPQLKTLLRFLGQVGTAYHFEILDKEHSKMYREAHATNHNTITYGRNDLRSGIFKRTAALDVLYGSKV